METKWNGVERRARKRFGRFDRIFTVVYNVERREAKRFTPVTAGFSGSIYTQVVQNKAVAVRQNG